MVEVKPKYNFSPSNYQIKQIELLITIVKPEKNLQIKRNYKNSN